MAEIVLERCIELDEIKGFRESILDADLVSLYIKKLNYSTPKKYITESVVSDVMSAEIDQEIRKNSYVDYSEDIPQITPYFTPDEYREIHNTEINDFEYITYDMNDPKTLLGEIKEAMKNNDEGKLLKLGWNPSVEPTAENLKFARERQIRWFNEHKKLRIIDISGLQFGTVNEANVQNPLIKFEPVYIVLLSHQGLNSKIIQKYTRSHYSHAGIAFDESLKTIYSFNAATPDPTKKEGMSIESVDFYKKSAKGVKIQVVTFFVTANVKQKLKKRCMYYVANKDKTHYDFLNFFRIIFNKTKDSAQSLSFVCSQFVDVILKSCNIDLTGKPSNLVFPGDFETPVPGSKLYIVFKDTLEKFKPSAIRNKVRELLSLGSSSEELLTVPAIEAVQNFLESMNLKDLMVKTESVATNQAIQEFLEFLKPEEAIVEARHIPVRFNNRGDFFINLPRNMEQEYQEAHRLLTTYEEDNLDGIKHELAHLFYINYVLERRIRKSKNGDKQYKQYINLRARVLNDFKKYIKIVNKKERSFNFEAYLKDSDYYTKVVRIDRPTMMYSGKLITDFLKSQGI